MRTRLVLLITAILVALPAAANAVTPVRVLDTPDADEQSSAMQGDFFGWTSNSAGP
jgi:hypothetical protein